MPQNFYFIRSLLFDLFFFGGGGGWSWGVGLVFAFNPGFGYARKKNKLAQKGIKNKLVSNTCKKINLALLPKLVKKQTI